jgi:hypothetical protein
MIEHFTNTLNITLTNKNNIMDKYVLVRFGNLTIDMKKVLFQYLNNKKDFEDKNADLLKISYSNDSDKINTINENKFIEIPMLIIKESELNGMSISQFTLATDALEEINISGKYICYNTLTNMLVLSANDTSPTSPMLLLQKLSFENTNTHTITHGVFNNLKLKQIDNSKLYVLSKDGTIDINININI